MRDLLLAFFKQWNKITHTLISYTLIISLLSIIR